jgi:hypothetical protein
LHTLEPFLFQSHETLVIVDPGDLHIDGGQLSLVTGRERRCLARFVESLANTFARPLVGLCSKSRADPAHPFKSAGNSHLLVELRT